MKIFKNIIYIPFLTALLLLGACNKDVLNRPELTKVIDSEFWKNESHLRLYSNNFYANYFVGYNSAWGTAYAPLRGYNFADDFSTEGRQSEFETTVPNSRGANSSTPAVLTSYSGPNWNFYWVRDANIMIDRLENHSKQLLEEEAFNHWMSVGRFFRGFEYSRLVGVFGDVPYFDSPVEPTDFETMYKDRDDRGYVMDKVYEDFEYVLENMRLNDGTQQLNRYIAASFISSLMLFEGSWQHYHNVDKDRAKKYLELAVKAASFVMESGNWSFGKDFKSLFASENLAGHPEVIMHRTYDEALKVTHHIGSYSNGYEDQVSAANLDLVKSFICSDGKNWQNSSIDNADNFSLAKLAVTRDPRFEATFMDVVNTASNTLIYAYKFAAREALNYIGGVYPPKWGSNTNTNDAPVVRLAEVVLNWLEAKAILAENFGGSPILQNDIDRSINAIRKRPLDDEAMQKGVQQTAPLMLNQLPNDPERDSDVSQLMWEIRRERRMEFVYEHTRLNDLRRWKKLHYMDFSRSKDYGLGPWVDFPKELPARLASNYVNVLKVINASGREVVYNGNNASEMVGFYVIPRFENRTSYNEKVYLAPVGINQIQQYTDLGYTLKQTKGW